MLSLELELALLEDPAVFPATKDTARVSATAHVANSYGIAFDTDKDGKSYPDFENPNWEETADIILSAQPWRGKHAVRRGRDGTILPE